MGGGGDRDRPRLRGFCDRVRGLHGELWRLMDRGLTNPRVAALQEAQDHAGPRQERQAGAQPDRGDGVRDEQVTAAAAPVSMSPPHPSASGPAVPAAATAAGWRPPTTTTAWTWRAGGQTSTATADTR